MAYAEVGNIAPFVLCIKLIRGKLKRPRRISQVSPCVVQGVIINLTTGNESRMFNTRNKTE